MTFNPATPEQPKRGRGRPKLVRTDGLTPGQRYYRKYKARRANNPKRPRWSKSKHGLTPEEKFWPKVDKTPGQGPEGECWEWRAGLNYLGYGQFGIRKGKGFSPMGAHVFSYVLHYGPVPDGLEICHNCDNRACVNPHHLIADTHQENIRQAFIKYGLIEEISLSSLAPHALTCNPSETIEQEVDRSIVEAILSNMLDRLTPKQQRVIIHRFGLYGETAKTLEEIGQMQGCTRERIRQIEAKALERLRHPAVSKELRAALAA